VDPATTRTGAAHGVRRRPLGHLARARCGGEIVAESERAIRVDSNGGPPILLFPEADVHTERLAQSDRDEVVAPVIDRPEGLVPLDPDRVQIDVVDTMGSREARDTTIKHFPTWGDLDDLLDVMDVRPEGTGRYRSMTRFDWRRPVVEGSQMLGQAVVAAGKHVPGRRVVSAHMVFARVASTEEPLEFLVEELSSGRTMTTLRVDVLQDDRRCASGTLLLDRTAPDVIRHSAAPPPGPGPYDSPPFDMGVTGRDVRVVDGAYDDDPQMPAGPPLIDSWVRFRPLPAEPYFHAGLLAQYTGHMSIAAALRAHEGVSQRDAHRSLSTAINAIAISFHRDVRVDDWMLYHHLSTFAGEGMTHSECRVHGTGGQLLASFSVDAMVRSMEATHGRPERTVL
jgi:acyl-CoA thioesterase